MSLLDDVSIVVTPNGYKAGRLYGVLPVPTEGSELLTNGDFSSGSTGWTAQTGWLVTTGSATCDGTNAAYLFQSSGSLPIGKLVIVTVNITSYTSGTLRLGATGVGIDANSVSGIGTHTVIFTTISSGTSDVELFSQNFIGSIDNVSVKEYTASDMSVTRATAATRVDENGLVNYAQVVSDTELITNGGFDTDSDWNGSGSNGWTISGGKASNDGTSGSNNLSQSGILEVGKQYKIDITVSNYVSGNVEVSAGASPRGTMTANGTYTFYQTCTPSTTFYIIANSFDGSIDNVSVKEVDLNNVPRIDYTGGGCPHILSEPQRTNLVTYSESISNLSRTTNGTGTLTITDNYTDSPQGLQNASRVQMSIVDTNDTSNYRLINAGSVMITGVTREISFYAKSLTGSNQDVLVYWSYDQQIVTLTNDWQRFKISATSGSSSKVFIGTRGGSGSYFSGGDANLDFALWGLQVEDDGSGGGSSYATSYIPTSGSTVTRNQDQFSRDGIGSLINDSEGVLFVEAKTIYDSSTSRRISLSDGSINNRVMLEFDETTENTIKAVITTGGVNSAIMTFAASDLSQYNKIAIKYKLNDFSIWFNGTEVVTDSSGGVPTGLTQLVLDGGDGSNFFYGEVKQLQVYDTALTDMQLIQLTGTSGTDFYESYSEMAESLTYTIQ